MNFCRAHFNFKRHQFWNGLRCWRVSSYSKQMLVHLIKVGTFQCDLWHSLPQLTVYNGCSSTTSQNLSDLLSSSVIHCPKLLRVTGHSSRCNDILGEFNTSIGQSLDPFSSNPLNRCDMECLQFAHRMLNCWTSMEIKSTEKLRTTI